jgi:hypothetical protein
MDLNEVLPMQHLPLAMVLYCASVREAKLTDDRALAMLLLQLLTAHAQAMRPCRAPLQALIESLTSMQDTLTKKLRTLT